LEEYAKMHYYEVMCKDAHDLSSAMQIHLWWD